MASELQLLGYPTHGLTTIYVEIRKGATFVRASNGALIPASPANVPLAAVVLSDSLRPGDYLGDMPAGTPLGQYVYIPRIMAGGSAADGDLAAGGVGIADWSGNATTTLAGVQAQVAAINPQTDKIGTSACLPSTPPAGYGGGTVFNETITEQLS